MITTAMSAAIAADRGSVWDALASPNQRIRWDDRVLALLDPARQPRVGQRVRWRYQLGTVAIVVHETPLEVRPRERLRSATSLGLFRFQETWTLAEENGGGTRLTLKLVASNSVPVVGGLLDRFAVRRLATELIDSRLRALQKWCEAGR